jgi:hypothetical protein
MKHLQISKRAGSGGLHMESVGLILLLSEYVMRLPDVKPVEWSVEAIYMG